MNGLTQAECQQFLDLGGNAQTDLGAPSTVAATALAIWSWIDGLTNVTDHLNKLNLIRAFIRANGGTSN